jgi:hypothetical protein
VTFGNPPRRMTELLADLARFNKYYASEPPPEIDQAVINELLNSEQFFNDMKNVTKFEVVSAENIHAGSAFIGDLEVERIGTNRVAFICTPNLEFTGKFDANGIPICNWTDDARTYRCGQSGGIQPRITMEGISLSFIENRLVPVSNALKIDPEAVEPLKVGGRQLYFTSILGGDEPYAYMGYEPPSKRFPSISEANAAMFTVYTRKIEDPFVKAAFEFVPTTLSDGTVTLSPGLWFGIGDENGNGRLFIRLDADAAFIVRTTRTGAGVMPIGAELGIKIDDRGAWYTDVNTGTYQLIGSGSGGGGGTLSGYVIARIFDESEELPSGNTQYHPSVADVEALNVGDVFGIRATWYQDAYEVES